MNWLAHIFLSPDDEDIRIGNLLGDFINNPSDKDELTIKMLLGIQMHIEVDKFTDFHPIFIQSKRRISTHCQRLGGILIDIFYDHFLAKHWHDYHRDTLEKFTTSFYASLEKHFYRLPLRLKKILPVMKKENWLASYRDLEGIKYVLNRLSRRISRPNPMADGIHELTREYQSLTEDFLEFFPLLRKFASQPPPPKVVVC